MPATSADSDGAAQLTGKCALITGSTGGIGYAVAECLAGAGCNIVLHGLEAPPDVEEKRRKLQRDHGVAVLYHPADLTEIPSIAGLAGAAAERFEAVDILVNNAVVRHFAPVDEFSVESWDQAIAVNLSAAFHTIRLTLPAMRARRWGRIVNMSSIYGAIAVADRIDYVTTKTGLIGMTRAVAIETLRHGITCNAICPGAIHTPSSEGRIQSLMQAEALPRDSAIERFLESRQPTGRFVEASHVAALILFLCGPAGRDITGAALPIDGGWLAS